MGTEQNNFTFRLISRGEISNKLTERTVRALHWCHPDVQICIVDANDQPQFAEINLPNVTIINIVPGDDIIAQKFGRGTKKHLFYWRHSPYVLSALPYETNFIAHLDSDILFMRPMNLSALVSPLKKGRICISLDESMVSYSNLIQQKSNYTGSIINIPGSCGPLLQGGLIFTNKKDDGDIFKEFWQLAITAASEDIIDQLPLDDMTLLTSLLTYGGKLWERFLALGPEWNFITAAGQDPGVFSIGAHYGGYWAKKFLLDNLNQFLITNHAHTAWGSVPMEFKSERWFFQRGVISGSYEKEQIVYRLKVPFAVSWRCLNMCNSFDFEIIDAQHSLPCLFLFIDGTFHSQTSIRNPSIQKLKIQKGSVISLITVSDVEINNPTVTVKCTDHNAKILVT